MANDTSQLRKLIASLLPGLVIEATASPSGQRVVYFAKFQAPGKLEHIKWGNVVVKVAEELSPRQIAYLQKEIHLLNSLSSPYYPKLYYDAAFSRNPDTGDALPNRILVSIEERVDAEPLSKYKQEFSTEAKVRKLLLDLIEGLELLWSRPEKIVHRDLKPANILIRKNGSVVIIDLGIVREEGTPGLTEDEAQWGPCTPPYASPEQARNDKKNISFKSDFFTLGTIAYELLSGSNPYYSRNDSKADILDKIRTFIPPSLHTIGAASKSFSDVIARVMTKEPYERFRGVSRFKQALLDCGKASDG